MEDAIKKLKELSLTEPIASYLDLRLLEISSGYAKASIKMKPQYINFVSKVFGGIIMSVTDQAMAYATNSLFSPNVATQFNTHFIAAAAADDGLTAECRVIKSGKRFCVSQITVVNQDGKLVASATGTTIPLVK